MNSIEGQTRNILITGGLGFIGSHTSVQLYQHFSKKNPEKDFKITIIDNLSNCTIKVLDRIVEILSNSCKQKPEDVQQRFQVHIFDVLDTPELEKVFKENIEKKTPITDVIHMAGKQAVGEAASKPLLYFEVNVQGSVNVLKCMEKFNCKNLIFSSSATVYESNAEIKEDFPIKPFGVYGESKMMVQLVMRATSSAHPDFSLTTLRYFNPAGAHPSGLIGDCPSVFPNNLFPYIEQIAVGNRPHLNVFGNDYPTPDGTGVRDYIHIVDLAKGHVAALDRIEARKGFSYFNLGTGKGSSVLDIVKAYSKAIGKEIPYQFAERRSGDVPISTANVDKANQELEWKATLNLEDMCRDSFNFITKNLNGMK